MNAVNGCNYELGKFDFRAGLSRLPVELIVTVVGGDW